MFGKAKRWAPVAAVAMAVLGSAGPAAAHDGTHGPSTTHPSADVTEKLEHVRGLGLAKRLANGLYEVRPETGPPVLTHGLDSPAARPLKASKGRPPVCADTNNQHVLYGRPAGAPDRLSESLATIESAIWGMNAELNRSAIASGGRHADYRFACNADGTIKISTFVNARGPSFSAIIDAARSAGATDPNSDYTIFYDDASTDACGVGSYIKDTRLAEDNRSNRGGGYGVAYPACWTAATIMHENAHNQGAVQPDAPNGTGSGGHCRDESDVLCYSDGGDRDSGIFQRCDGGEQFDCGDDDYFDVAPEAGEYLATHWNLGSPLNRFIEFTDVATGDNPAQPSTDCAGRDSDGDLAADRVDCPTSQPGSQSVRILRSRLRVRSGHVRVGLECRSGDESACLGRLRLVANGGRVVGNRSFEAPAGGRATVSVLLSRSARQAWKDGRLRRVRVVAGAGVARTSALRPVSRR